MGGSLGRGLTRSKCTTQSHVTGPAGGLAGVPSPKYKTLGLSPFA